MLIIMLHHKLIYNCKVEDNETLMQNKVNVSLEKSDNKFSFEKISKNIDIKFYQNAIEQTQERIDTILKNNVISDEEKNNVRANVRSKSISNITQLHTNKKNIRVLYSALKDLNNPSHISLSSLLGSNKKDDNMSKKYNYDKKLYVLGVDKIVIEEEDVVEKERRRILRRYENSR